MSRLTRILSYVEVSPKLVIEIILAVVLLAFAIYLGSPWYVAGPTTVIGNSLEAGEVRVFTAILYMIPSVLTLVGVYRNNRKARLYGTFGLFLAFTFTVILRWLTVGFIPFLWIHALALAMISSVMYLQESRRIDDD